MYRNTQHDANTHISMYTHEFMVSLCVCVVCCEKIDPTTMKGSLLPLFLATAVVVVASVMSVCAASVESPITMNGEAAWPQEAVAAALQDTPGFQVASIRGYKLLDTFERSQLYEVEADGYADPVKLVVLRGLSLKCVCLLVCVCVCVCVCVSVRAREHPSPLSLPSFVLCTVSACFLGGWTSKREGKAIA